MSPIVARSLPGYRKIGSLLAGPLRAVYRPPAGTRTYERRKAMCTPRVLFALASRTAGLGSANLTANDESGAEFRAHPHSRDWREVSTEVIGEIRRNIPGPQKRTPPSSMQY